MTCQATVHSTEAVFRSPVSIERLVLDLPHRLHGRDVLARRLGAERQAQAVLLDADLQHLVDHRQLEVQPGHGRGVVLAEPQHDGLLVRLDGVRRVEDQAEQKEQAQRPRESAG